MAASRFPVLRGPDAQQSRVQDSIQGVLAPVAKALQGTPIMGAPPPSWIYGAPLNGFVAPALPQFSSIAFMKDALGFVHVQMSATHAVGTAALTTIFILPMGYRSRQTLPFAGMGSAGAYQGVFMLNTGEVQNRLIMAANAVIYANFSFLAEG
jgi:hypothetical protein